MDPDSPEIEANLHAPWRIPYIRSLSGESDGCFLCKALDGPDSDEDNLLLWRTPGCLVIMNRFPYTGGHLLIAPRAHVAGLDDLDRDVRLEIMNLTNDCLKILSHAFRAEGFNVGLNLGRCAGAGLPDHIHLHIVPRWSGDSNFMAVLADIRMVHQAMGEMRAELLAAGEELKLPEVLYGR